MGLNIKVSSIHWGSWNISPAHKEGLLYVDLRNHPKVFGSQEINLMQVVTIYCIDIFTKYYNESPFYSDKSKTQGFSISALNPLPFFAL